MLNVLILKSMNIDEKKLNGVKNEIKEIFDNVYGRDTEKVFWYLVALHIMKTDREVKYKIEGKKVQISDFHWDDDITSDYDKERLQERLARLAGGIAVIKVGDVSETALKEKKYRVEDALNATRAGIDEGIIAGGGTALCQISYSLKNNPKAIGDSDYMRGYNIVLDAITRPLKQIAENCGLSGDVVADKVQNSSKGVGFNALTGQYVDMIADGVIDPVKVTRLALLNASSVASLILTSSCSITTKPDPRENDPMNGMKPM